MCSILYTEKRERESWRRRRRKRVKKGFYSFISWLKKRLAAPNTALYVIYPNSHMHFLFIRWSESADFGHQLKFVTNTSKRIGFILVYLIFSSYIDRIFVYVNRLRLALATYFSQDFLRLNETKQIADIRILFSVSLQAKEIKIKKVSTCIYMRILF